MARQRSPDSVKAQELYHSGMSLADIARKLNKPEGTVRRWKSTQKWDSGQGEQKSERSKNKASVRKSDRAIKAEAVAEDVRQVMDNPELTDKQRLFCLHYVKCFNATKAYLKAYKCGYGTAMVEGSKMLRNPKARAQIMELKQNRLNREMLEESDVFQWYLDIARADMKDFMEFGNEEVDVVDKQGDEHTIKVSTVNIKNDYEVDGILISEISKGKDGVKVKLSDRLKAMNWIAEHMDLATEKQRAEIEVLRSKVSGTEESTEKQIASYMDKLEGVVRDEPE